LANVTGIA